MQADDLFRLDGRSVLITGAGGGIGRALVAAFQAAGAIVTGVDRLDAMMDGLVLAHRLVFDITDAAATDRAVRGLIGEAGAPDVLINNAGFTRGETLAQVDGAVWDSEIAINLDGPFHVTAPVAAAMAARGSGVIVFISSVNALAHHGNPAYSAAKAGVIAYARALAVEYGAQGVRANVVCPGSVRSPAWDHRFERDPTLLDRIAPHYPLGRMVEADEVARATLFLASPAASGITGVTLPVDAGLMAGNLRFVRDVIGER